MATRPSLTLKRRIKAPPQKVYEAWTRPEKMIQWWGVMGGPRPPTAETDLRVGGRFRVQSWMPSGEYNSVSGTYSEIVPNEKLVFSWAWQSTPERVSLVTIELRPTAQGTEQHFRHDRFFDQQARDNHERGWTATFAKLDEFFA